MRAISFAVIPLAGLAAAVAPWSTLVAGAGTNGSVWSAGYANEAIFHANGDDLLNCDFRADGHHAVVRWVDGRNPTKVHTARNYGGNGSCKNALAGVNLPEGSGITFMSCVGEGTRIYNCGAVKVANP